MLKKREYIGLFILFIISVGLNLAIGFGAGILDARSDVDIPWWLPSLLCEAAIVLPAFIYVKVKGGSILSTVHFRRVHGSTIFKTLLLSLTVTPVYMFANVLSQLLVPNTVVQAANSLLADGVWLTFLFTVVVAPICEELCFRGVFLNRIRRVSSLVPAVVISALFFGIIHLNLNQFCYAFVLGIFFGLTNAASGSIYTSMIMHAVINTIGTATLYMGTLASEALGQDLAEAAEEARASESYFSGLGIYGILAAVGVILSLLLIRSIAKKEGTWRK
ncbi:MAG: type II CAAX endopeptidase family protein [Eubacteriales bacterium]|nr:type II CAAX endopeptidase family protein [Eubacteriales bacterium]